MIFVIILVFIFSILIVVWVTCRLCTSGIRIAAWKTLRRNHPELEKAFLKHKNDKQFRKDVNRLLYVNTQEQFEKQSIRLCRNYPEFSCHMSSLEHYDKNEIWRRFLNHRHIAQSLVSHLWNSV